jgi:hypothetical protein
MALPAVVAPATPIVARYVVPAVVTATTAELARRYGWEVVKEIVAEITAEQVYDALRSTYRWVAEQLSGTRELTPLVQRELERLQKQADAHFRSRDVVCELPYSTIVRRIENLQLWSRLWLSEDQYQIAQPTMLSRDEFLALQRQYGCAPKGQISPWSILTIGGILLAGVGVWWFALR